jgi:hypothetical protein
VNQEQAHKKEASSILEPYLDDQVMESVFEAQKQGVKDLVIYLDLINELIYQLEREEVLKDPSTSDDLKRAISTPSRDAANFGCEVPGYISFWFVVTLPDNRLAAMACSISPKASSELN